MIDKTNPKYDDYAIEVMFGGSVIKEVGESGEFVLIFVDSRDGMKIAAPFLPSEISALLSTHPVKLIGYGRLLDFNPNGRPIVAWRLSKGVADDNQTD